jgi:hypothetical protein
MLNTITKKTIIFLLFNILMDYSFGQISIIYHAKKVNTLNTNAFFVNEKPLVGNYYLNRLISEAKGKDSTTKYRYKSKGFISIFEYIFEHDLTQQDRLRPNRHGLRLVIGYQINRHFTMGVGIAYNLSNAPLSFDMRYSLKEGKTSPILGLNVAKNIGKDFEKEPIMFNPTFGIKSYFSRKYASIFTAGVKWFEDEQYKRETVFLTLSGGLSF